MGWFVFYLSIFLFTNAEYKYYAKMFSDDDHGSIELGNEKHQITVEECQSECDADPTCDCIVYDNSGKKCYLKAACMPSMFKESQHWDVYLRTIKPKAFQWIANISYGLTNKKIFHLDPGTYLIDKQYEIPEGVTLLGSGSAGSSFGNTTIRAIPSIKESSSLCWENAVYRKGFLLNKNTHIGKFHFIGADNRLLNNDDDFPCGGAVFETPGCTGSEDWEDPPEGEDCDQNLGSGSGVSNVLIEDVSIEAMTVQSAVYISPTGAHATSSKMITMKKIRTNGTYADGVIIHGTHGPSINVMDCDIKNSGRNNYALWSIGDKLSGITFTKNKASYPGDKYNCFAVYGGGMMVFTANTCIGGNDGIVSFPGRPDDLLGGDWGHMTNAFVSSNTAMNPNIQQCFFPNDEFPEHGRQCH